MGLLNVKTYASVARLLCAIVLAISLGLMPFGVIGVDVTRAYAETESIDDAPNEMQQRIEASAQEYEDAVARVAELEQQISDNEKRAEELREQIPALQESSGVALGELYKLQREGTSIISLVLSSQDFNDLINRLEFIDRVYGKHSAEIEKLSAALLEQDELAASLSRDLSEARDQEARASEALAAAQAAREEAQRLAIQKQEEEAKNAAATEGSSSSSAGESSSASESGSSSGSSDGAGGGSETVNPPSQDGADWSSDKASFVNAWAGRIDAYLAGSPLSGQGANFAAAAWDYGVDPRFSPAISCVESSKGAVCFASYNAWGWGSVSWSSWEEAIDAHVRGLARGYGYTVTIEGAKKYCPPNWEHWYNRVSEEMNKI